MSERANTASPSASTQDFTTVFAALKPHMAALDAHLHAQLEEFEPEIREMADYCIDTSGKRIRPTLVFFSGWQNGAVSTDLVRIAAVVELVHLASLVHDDIMDDAGVRRSRPTAARSYGPTAAVLLGDALFSHALNLATRFPTTEVCQAVSESMRRVCAGEIIQTLRRGSTNISHADYQRIIDLKTAELFRVSCHLGARYGGYSDDFVRAAASFGRHLGIAYQVYDDLADFFGDEKKIGKTLGTDLASGKITLPIEALMEKLPAGERAELIEEITGKRPSRPSLRIQQMNDLGIYSVVAEAVDAEIKAGEIALAGFAEKPPVANLLRLGDALRLQVAALRKSGVG
ncbi:MAG: polyprenyl synthetase family protein [Nibricoccus sp.]